MRQRTLIAILWAVSLVLVAQWSSRAQTDAASQGVVVTGPDLGFRVDGTLKGVSDRKVIGALVVRVNGKWIEATAAMQPQLIPAR